MIGDARGAGRGDGGVGCRNRDRHLASRVLSCSGWPGPTPGGPPSRPFSPHHPPRSSPLYAFKKSLCVRVLSLLNDGAESCGPDVDRHPDLELVRDQSGASCHVVGSPWGNADRPRRIGHEVEEIHSVVFSNSASHTGRRWRYRIPRSCELEKTGSGGPQLIVRNRTMSDSCAHRYRRFGRVADMVPRAKTKTRISMKSMKCEVQRFPWDALDRWYSVRG